MNEKKKNRFLKILAAIIAVIIICFLVWVNVEHRLIPAGAGSFEFYTVGYDDGTGPGLTGEIIFGNKAYCLSEEGKDKLVELLRTCRMKIHLGSTWDYTDGNDNLMFGVQYKANGRTSYRSIRLFGGSLEVTFSSRSMGFPGSIFLSDTNYMARISNYTGDEFISLVRQLCEQYGIEQ